MIVLDCSAAVAMVLRTPEGVAMNSLLLTGEKVISSTLFQAELSSSFWKYERSGVMDRKQALRHIDAALRLVNEFHDITENLTESHCEAVRLDHSPYDLLYFTLSRRYAATLFTLDRKLIALCEKEGVDCVHQTQLI